MATTDSGLAKVPKSICEDARSTAAAPLLNFLIHFAEQPGHYSDALQGSRDSKFKEIVQKPGPNPLPDESGQLYEVLMNLMEYEPGKTPIPSGSTVGCQPSIRSAGDINVDKGYNSWRRSLRPLRRI